MSSSPLTRNVLVVRLSGVLSVTVDDDVMLLNMATSKYYGLQKVSRFIWDNIDQPIRVDELCTRLQNEFSVDAETCERETLMFLEQLRTNQLIEVKP